MFNKFTSAVTFCLILGVTSVVAEPSVYGFGTESVEQGGYSSQNSMKRSKATIASLRQKIAEQNERIDGLTTIVEGLSATLNTLQQRREASSSMKNSTSCDNTALLKKLGAMIDKINADYVSKAELQKVLKSKGRYNPVDNTEKPKNSSSDSLKGKSTATLYREGVRLFMKKRYSSAKKHFEMTDLQGYKPAASNYYLGEIAYYTKQYEDAIFYFKKSAGLYDQASYIDTLLLHTAISLEKSGEKAQAKAFYENIIANYAGKKSAKIAKQKLKKL